MIVPQIDIVAIVITINAGGSLIVVIVDAVVVVISVEVYFGSAAHIFKFFEFVITFSVLSSPKISLVHKLSQLLSKRIKVFL